MTRPLVLELKGLLSDVLSSEKEHLREKMLNDALNLMEELQLDSKQIIKAMKSELEGKKEKVDAIVKKTLEEVDKLEYEDNEDLDKTYH